MKKNIPFHFIGFAFSLLVLLSACKKDNATRTYTMLRPVYKDKATVLAEINGNPAQQVENAGKIYIKDKFILLSDVDKGIHVYDNSNPAKPVQTAFLKIPGNQDIAVKGNTLYADMYSDLLAIDISNVRNVHVTKVLQNMFQDRMYINGYAVDSTQVFADWIKKDTTVAVDNNIYYDDQSCQSCFLDLASASFKSSSTGVAGSMARMVLMNDYMYAVTASNNLGVINISNAADPVGAGVFNAGFDLQTVYPFQGKLFLGSSSGMFMYDVSNPESPTQLGQFWHGRSCDPVITDGKFAYVTLHAGSFCGGDINEMNVVNVEDLNNPYLLKTYAMTKPTGLSKDGNLLFVCDGNALKVYDATEPAALSLKRQIFMTEPYDVIAGNNKLLVVAKDGIYQYDYTIPNYISKLSVIPVKN